MKFFGTILLSVIILTGIFSGCTLNNVNQDDAAETYFKQNNLKGTFALLDNVHEQFTVYNLKAYRDSSFAPGGTFQVLSTLLALETGRYLDEHSKVINNEVADTTTLGDAFLNGNDSLMGRVAASIGKDTLQFWLDSLHYGKARLQSADENVWNNDSLRLTPDEQLGFMAKLYFVQLPFQKRVQQIVRSLMIREENTLYTLAYKSSWDQLPSGKYSGWISGWIEENKRVYFFVIHGEPTNGTPTKGSLLKTAKEILKYYGFFEGKK
ncbi:beta-lactamase class D [Arachidicoccus rhizosphaerae]|jgi:beta-lactamase class D|uniref:Beta-lactamase class D n=1 Tax=Arachidicoccus rhizosphaerae TaxID=551991 RepID=A0A1H3WJC2_9BACT|nr:penicillin-binding transpeptidase domain-containing protein [Arachidicoccus rhizosphaerae]SDZ87225.1 beta-lactamase class D [Arachidicoccus rhizosphaerae]